MFWSNLSKNMVSSVGLIFPKPWSTFLNLPTSPENNVAKGIFLYYSDGSIISIPKLTKKSGLLKKKGKSLILIKFMGTNGKSSPNSLTAELTTRSKITFIQFYERDWEESTKWWVTGRALRKSNKSELRSFPIFRNLSILHLKAPKISTFRTFTNCFFNSLQCRRATFQKRIWQKTWKRTLRKPSFTWCLWAPKRKSKRNKILLRKKIIKIGKIQIKWSMKVLNMKNLRTSPKKKAIKINKKLMIMRFSSTQTRKS